MCDKNSYINNNNNNKFIICLKLIYLHKIIFCLKFAKQNDGSVMSKSFTSPFLSPKENKISGPLHCHGHELVYGCTRRKIYFSVT